MLVLLVVASFGDTTHATPASVQGGGPGPSQLESNDFQLSIRYFGGLPWRMEGVGLYGFITREHMSMFSAVRDGQGTLVFSERLKPFEMGLEVATFTVRRARYLQPADSVWDDLQIVMKRVLRNQPGLDELGWVDGVLSEYRHRIAPDDGGWAMMQLWRPVELYVGPYGKWTYVLHADQCPPGINPVAAIRTEVNVRRQLWHEMEMSLKRTGPLKTEFHPQSARGLLELAQKMVARGLIAEAQLAKVLEIETVEAALLWHAKLGGPGPGALRK